ncbi:3-phenylpropionate/trans-cinnamate dioxygenase ferredoxin reductase subunit [Lipingzhangella halophila]|uniref:3-phenylpropionate/trans-cinnamate dioxygenase ferredoxin reductase subunit n=1 Tax=Lipingzhangella halophila TaxID=1783352 RepID=A0A7W7RIZ1_9ACTN|nr:FAD-dependent oxidoreductase [Lipingzhangella halophila]MBB4932737.1 3-phenylpropionate/trans-cinnamate dioxygenase ferredoxin reductase subunit [Lipingzhangella halophila]
MGTATQGSRVVVVGAGQAGVETAACLRDYGYVGPITLLGEEPTAPYQRPPLSKDFLSRRVDADGLELRSADFYADRGIELATGRRVDAILPAERRVLLDGGGGLGYRHLVLATGARNRPLTVPGADLDGVCYLRTLAEAVALREWLTRPRELVVVGGGFIGLELAAVAAAGHRVTVVEAAPRCMARVVTPVVSDHAEAAHRRRGVEVLTGTGVRRILGTAGRVRGVELAGGRTVPADVVVVGIGAVAATGLAAEAGLVEGCAKGIITDEHGRTSAPGVFAVGDCAAQPGPGGALIRLESVPGAIGQAKRAAAAIAGVRGTPYGEHGMEDERAPAVPWFWSHQGELRLQIAGLPEAYDRAVVRGDPAAGRFSVFRFSAGELAAVESVNRPVDHMAARKLLARSIPITPEEAAELTFDLKSAATARA